MTQANYNNNKSGVKMLQNSVSITVGHILRDLKELKVSRVADPRCIVPTILAVKDAIGSVSRGEDVTEKIEVIHKDLRFMSLVN